MMIKRQFSLRWHCGYVIDNKMKMPCVDSCVKCLGMVQSLLDNPDQSNKRLNLRNVIESNTIRQL